MTSTKQDSFHWVSDDALQACEALLFDDDDLVTMFINIAISHAVGEILSAVPDYPVEREREVITAHAELRLRCAEDRDEFAKRFRTYIRNYGIPF